MPSNSVPVSAIRPLVSMIDGIGSLCRSPISKSFGIVGRCDFDCAGAEFRVDVFVGDDDQLTVSTNGCGNVLPTRWR